MYNTVVAAEDGTDIDDPVIGTQMLYTSGTTGRPKGVHRRQRRGERAGHRQLLRLRRGLRAQRRRPSPHRAALPRRAAGLLGGGPLSLRRAHRRHGPLGPRRGAAPHRAARHHPHPHGPDDVPPPARPARRDAGALRHLVAALRDPRRGTVPRPGQAAPHRVAGAGGGRVLRGHRGPRHPGRLRHLAGPPRHGRPAHGAGPGQGGRRRRQRPAPPARSAWSSCRRRPPPSSTTTATPRRRPGPSAATTSPWATWATWTTRGTSSSPTARPT